MRRNKRGMYEDNDNYRGIIILAGVILVIAIIAFFIVYGIYNNKIKSSELAKEGELNPKVSVTNLSNNSVSVSSEIGKTVNEVKNSMTENKIDNHVNNEITLTTSSVDNKVSNSINIASSNNKKSLKPNIVVEQPKEEPKVVEEKEPVFAKPIEEGDVYREFAKENLVFSETLQEWITHLGIDIKAPKTTVVMASEDGTVESIKNDPRYGLTVIIKHAKDYKTVYSNLLTSEFVNVGDEVKKGQSIGTVGNNAAFEIADEPHLHFEIIKSGEKVDPTLYIR